ncbi:MAG: Permease of the drug/metabolite transporter (DMT) superfamily, partial [uncultured Paraburkholderia sp.]
MKPAYGAIYVALAAAALFGAATPLAKALLGSVSPFMLNGMDAPTQQRHRCARVEVSSTTRTGRGVTMQITTIGIDLAKN